MLTHTQSLNPTKGYAILLTQLTKSGWREFAGQENILKNLKDARELVALEKRGTRGINTQHPKTSRLNYQHSPVHIPFRPIFSKKN